VTAMLEMRPIENCSVSGCSYNDHSSCHAFAITVGGHGEDAACATFIPLSAKGGLTTVHGAVGACQRTDCMHNEMLECTAPSIRVGAGHDLADCLTYTAR
jgi:Domain of Unknown Function (DUF1540)